MLDLKRINLKLGCGRCKGGMNVKSNKYRELFCIECGDRLGMLIGGKGNIV